MARKVPQKPSAAYFEDYDDDADSVIPDTRQSANIAAKRSKSDIRSLEIAPLDFASDSGYSSRTAATGNSSQSRTSARPSPLPLTLDTKVTAKPVETARVKESRKDKGKQRDEKRASADIIQMNARAVAPPPRSSSKSRRQSVTMPHPPDGYWPYPNGYPNLPGYPLPNPVDHRAVDYSSFYYPQHPPVQDIPPQSPQAGRYPYLPYGSEMHVAQSPHRQRRPSHSSVYHLDERPVSYHAGMPDAMYNPGGLPATPFNHGPPPALSAYYTQPSTPHQQYYTEPGSPYQAVFERQRASSTSRPREHGRRRSSIYGRPVVEHTTPKPSYEDDHFLERQFSKEYRSRRPSETRRPVDEEALDEDYYRMPPPPPPPPKAKAQPPKVIQKRPEHPPKSMTTGSVPPTSRRMSHSRDSWDLSDLKQALPHQQIRKISGVPERSQSMKATRRMSYHAPDGARRIAVEDSRRRRTLYYNDERDSRREPATDLEQKHRNAEEYQAAKSGRTGIPLTADALRLKTKIAQRQDSDSGSQKSRSNSSRGSDARTRDGSGVGSRFDDDSITMTMNGMTMTFPQGAVNGKTIHLRTDEQGAIGLNIEGRRPKKYIMPPGSEFTSASSRREIEDGRRPRDDRRSDRASRVSSRSTFSGR